MTTFPPLYRKTRWTLNARHRIWIDRAQKCVVKYLSWTRNDSKLCLAKITRPRSCRQSLHLTTAGDYPTRLAPVIVPSKCYRKWLHLIVRTITSSYCYRKWLQLRPSHRLPYLSSSTQKYNNHKGMTTRALKRLIQPQCKHKPASGNCHAKNQSLLNTIYNEQSHWLGPCSEYCVFYIQMASIDFVTRTKLDYKQTDELWSTGSLMDAIKLSQISDNYSCTSQCLWRWNTFHPFPGVLIGLRLKTKFQTPLSSCTLYSLHYGAPYPASALLCVYRRVQRRHNRPHLQVQRKPAFLQQSWCNLLSLYCWVGLSPRAAQQPPPPSGARSPP